ncbi:MAG: TadE/TadG family type IV pilus assembly protein [Isosphaeraceae bacterium]
MIVRKRSFGNRRGTTVVECAVVYPVTIMLLLGTIIMGLGVFRYQQLQALSREGARYASVHGPTYASATGQPEASTSTVLTYVEGLAVGLNGLNCTAVNFTPSTMPCTVSVTLTYTWTPGAIFNSMTWTVTSTMAVSY